MNISVTLNGSAEERFNRLKEINNTDSNAIVIGKALRLYEFVLEQALEDTPEEKIEKLQSSVLKEINIANLLGAGECSDYDQAKFTKVSEAIETLISIAKEAAMLRAPKDTDIALESVGIVEDFMVNVFYRYFGS